MASDPQNDQFERFRSAAVREYTTLTRGLRYEDPSILTHISTYMEEMGRIALGQTKDHSTMSAARKELLTIPGEGEGLGLVKRLDEAVRRAVDAAKMQK